MEMEKLVGNPTTVSVSEVVKESKDARTLVFEHPGVENVHSGQFVMVWVPGVDEIPMSVSFLNPPLMGITVLPIGEATIALASENRLIMAEQEELLQKANTPLIESRALQHTVNEEEVQAKAQESLELSNQAQASAEEALRGLDTRRLGMIVALAVILITVVALVLIKRELDRDLEAKRARRDSSAS